MTSSRSRTASRTWRDIPQQVKPRAMSRKGRQRKAGMAFRSWLVVLFLLAAGGGLLYLLRIWRTNPEQIANAVDAKPIARLELETDGTLDGAWLQQTLRIPEGTTLLAIDLGVLRQRLLDDPQVLDATLSRQWPDRLSIVLRERFPVARLNARGVDGALRTLLVAADGTVFAGTGYGPEHESGFPWLDGISLHVGEDGFLPITEMNVVADLLTRARDETQALYGTWRVVDLSRLASDGEILVRASDIAEIVFGTSEDFFTQLARLDAARDLLGGPIQSINLAMGSQVTWAPVSSAAPASRRPVAADNFPSFRILP